MNSARECSVHSHRSILNPFLSHRKALTPFVAISSHISHHPFTSEPSAFWALDWASVPVDFSLHARHVTRPLRESIRVFDGYHCPNQDWGSVSIVYSRERVRHWPIRVNGERTGRSQRTFSRFQLQHYRIRSLETESENKPLKSPM
jgi:hypothetical protein